MSEKLYEETPEVIRQFYDDTENLGEEKSISFVDSAVARKLTYNPKTKYAEYRLDAKMISGKISSMSKGTIPIQIFKKIDWNKVAKNIRKYLDKEKKNWLKELSLSLGEIREKSKQFAESIEDEEIRREFLESQRYINIRLAFRKKIDSADDLIDFLINCIIIFRNILLAIPNAILEELRV